VIRIRNLDLILTKVLLDSDRFDLKPIQNQNWEVKVLDDNNTPSDLKQFIIDIVKKFSTAPNTY